MSLEAYRVRKSFQWDGWMYAPSGPNGECKCDCTEEEGCYGYVGAGCMCHDTACHCDCGIASEMYAGDVWLVEERHPRKDVMLQYRFATYDASLPSVDELMQKEEYKRLLAPYKPVSSKGKRGRVAATA